jgi:multiple antibiotic resistance protein
MLAFGTTAFMSILFLVDPPGTVPAFIALTERQTPEKRRRTALVASLTTTLTLMGFAAIGNVVFRVLGLILAGIGVQFVLNGLAAAGIIPKPSGG